MSMMGNVNLQYFTRLPVRVIQKVDGVGADILVTTPHKGEVIINMKDVHNPFFGSVTQTERGARSVVGELKELEREAAEWLFTGWLAKTQS